MWLLLRVAESTFPTVQEKIRTLLELARAADIVSVHVALKIDTRMSIGADFFAAMREGAYLINTSRGEVVDQGALVDAIKSKGIRAGLDVFAIEPTSAVAEFADPIANEASV